MPLADVGISVQVLSQEPTLTMTPIGGKYYFNPNLTTGVEKVQNKLALLGGRKGEWRKNRACQGSNLGPAAC